MGGYSLLFHRSRKNKQNLIWTTEVWVIEDTKNSNIHEFHTIAQFICAIWIFFENSNILTFYTRAQFICAIWIFFENSNILTFYTIGPVYLRYLNFLRKFKYSNILCYRPSLSALFEFSLKIQIFLHSIL